MGLVGPVALAGLAACLYYQLVALYKQVHYLYRLIHNAASVAAKVNH